MTPWRNGYSRVGIGNAQDEPRAPRRVRNKEVLKNKDEVLSKGYRCHPERILSDLRWNSLSKKIM